MDNGGKITPAGGSTAHVHYLPDMPGWQPPGDVGTITYIHTQAVASTTWTINHGLGWKPNVSVFDSGGTQIGGTVVHVSDTQLTISFTLGGGAYAVSGYAYLS
jgi:hypothetical protein